MHQTDFLLSLSLSLSHALSATFGLGLGARRGQVHFPHTLPLVLYWWEAEGSQGRRRRGGGAEWISCEVVIMHWAVGGDPVRITGLVS